MTLTHPVYGIMTYIFEWHNHPPYWWWGDSFPDSIRWSLMIAVITLGSVMINKSKLKPLENPDYKIMIWLVLFAVNALFVSMAFAIVPGDSMDKFDSIYKMVINFFLMIYIIRRPEHYRWIILVLLIGVANFGRVAWESGSNRDLGIMAPNATGGNPIATHVMVSLPFFAIYFLRGKRWLKVFTAGALPFALNLIILENSRAATMGLVAMGGLAPLLIKGRTRWTVILGLVVGGLLIFTLANDQFFEQQATTAGGFEADNSANTRKFLWAGAWNVMKDYPLGVGGEGFEIHFFDYVPELAARGSKDGGGKTVHNTFLNVGTEWGFLGLFFYLAFLWTAWSFLRQVKERSKLSPSLNFYYFEAVAVQLGFIGMQVGGLTHNRQYSEMVFWLCAFAVMLYNMQSTEIEYMRRGDIKALASFNKPDPEKEI